MSKTVLIANVDALGTAALPQNLSDGQIGMYSIAANGALTVLSGSPSGGQLALPLMVAVGGVSGNPRTIIFQPKNSSFGAVPYLVGATQAVVAPVPNVDIVGYTGATGDTTSIIANAVGTYNLTATNTSKTAPPLPFNLASLSYATVAAATPAAVALDWTKAINSKTLNTSLQPYDRFVMAQVLLNTVAGGGTPAGETAITTNGSTIVTTSATLGSNFVAGGYVRFGPAGATNTTTPVYKIASIDSTTQLTLTTPFVDPSLAIGATTTFTGSATTASSQITYIAAASVTSSTLAGVRLTSFGNWFNGSAFKEKYPNYSIAAGVSGTGPVGTPIVHNGVTAQSYSTGLTISSGVAKVGYGQGWQVQKQEFESQGFIGNTNRSWLPYPVEYYASATATYSGFTVKYKSSPIDAANAGYGREEDNELIVFGLTGSLTGFAAVRTGLAAYIA